MSDTITTKFSIGDRCYYVVLPTADILACVVDKVRIVPVLLSNPNITYKIHRVDTLQVLDYVEESEIDDFATSKATLLTWLGQQTTRITNMSEPA